MKLIELMSQCRDLGIKLGVKDDKVLVKGDKSLLTPELIAAIKNNKAEILAWFSDQQFTSVADIEPISRDKDLPLSYAQQRLWFIDRMDGASTQFNMPSEFIVEGAFNTQIASDVIRQIIARHETLRTVFVEQDGEPKQVIRESFDFHLKTLDLSHLTPQQQQAKLHHIVLQERAQSFALDKDLMLRATWVILQSGRGVANVQNKGLLAFNMHHIASDGWSMGLLVREFIEGYQRLIHKGDLSEHCDLAIQYADFAYWQNQFLAKDNPNGAKRQLEYWRKQLSEAPTVHSLALDYPRPEQKSHQGGVVRSQLSASATHRLLEFAKARQLSPFMLLHSMLALLISRHSHSHDIMLGTPVANRMRPELEPIIGFFVNSLVLRINTDFAEIDDYLQHIRQVNLDAQANQDVPFEHLLDECQVERVMAHTPLFQIMLSMNTNQRADLQLPELRFQEYQFDDQSQAWTANFDLELKVELNGINDREARDDRDPAEQELHFSWVYDKSLFKEERIQSFDAQFHRLLKALTGNQSRSSGKLYDLQMLGDEDIHQLLHTFNSPRRDYPLDTRVHQWFEQQVERTPEAIALVYDDVRLTYAQLNERANRVAHFLIEQGIGNNDLVGIYAYRSDDFLVGMLAAMKAGGAYVPLDPTNPMERLAYMIEDAQAKVVLTQTRLLSASDPLLDSSVLFEKLPKQCVRACLDDAAFWQRYAQHNPDVPGTGADYAYMIYTSGSTGRPKGALVHHAGAVNHIVAEFELLGFMLQEQQEQKAQQEQKEKYDQLAPHHFLQSAASSSDVSVWQFLAPVISGGKTVVLDDMTDLPKLVRLLQQEQVHLIQTAPAVLQVLVEYLQAQSQKHVSQLPDLKWLMIIAEPCPVPLINQWFELEPNIPVMNGFGPSEASDDITAFVMRKSLDERLTSIPIGKPIPNMTLYVMDEHQRLLPPGAIGELCVSGVGVGPGYWQNPERTASSFVANPYQDYPGIKAPGADSRKLYRTGDLGRWITTGEFAGELEFVGRIDHQVKIRGFRIEIGEIEHQLSLCDGVANQVVLVRQDNVNERAGNEAGDKYLTAYLIPENASFVTDLQRQANWLQQVQTRLQAQLPGYMVPTAYVVMARFPLTPADKIDKKALPAPEQKIASAQRAPLKTATELWLAATWQALLKLKADENEGQLPGALVGANDNFFQLGGHSILVVRLVARVRDKFAIELPVKAVFQHPQLNELAAYIDSLLGDDTTAGAAGEQFMQNAVQNAMQKSIQAMPATIKRLPLSYAQQRLWVIDKVDGNSVQYNMPKALKVNGEFNVAVAAKAISRIIERHEPLRTVFAEIDGEAVQIIRDAVPFSLQQIDLTSCVNPEPLIKAHINNEAYTPFNLASDVMLRARWLQTSAQQGVLLFNMHHIASDGWSLGVLVNEFVAWYRYFLLAEEAESTPSFEFNEPLPELAIRYADYAYWQREFLSSLGRALNKPQDKESNLGEQLSYWCKQLQDLPVVHSLPLDFARPTQKQHEGGVLHSQLSVQFANELQSVAVEQSVTPFMLIHAALAMVLSRHSNTQDIVIGTPVANRMQQELEPLIGFFVNTLVLRANTQFEVLADYLAHIRQVNLDAQANQDIPFELLVEQVQAPRSLQHTPLFQILLMMDNTEKQEQSLPGLHFSAIPEEEKAAKFDLSLSVDVNVSGSDAGVKFSWVYDKSLFTGGRIETLNDHLQRLLQSMVQLLSKASSSANVNAKSVRLTELSMLSASELNFLQYELNASQREFPQDTLVHELFEQQVQRVPDNIAVRFRPSEEPLDREQRMTYDELNCAANRVAWYLRSQGVSVGSLVGIRLNRSCDMLIAVLAVLKAGAAYVPFDPEHPVARLNWVVEDTGLAHMLTDSELAKGFDIPDSIQVINLDCPTFISALLQSSQDDPDANPGRLVDVDLDQEKDKEHKLTPDSLAYVIYTSGSTGKPKGVQVSHRNAVNFLSFATREFMPEHIEGAVVSSSLAFDATVGSLYPPLCCGQYVEILPDDASILERLEDVLLHDTRSLMYKITPAHLEAIASKDLLPVNTSSRHLLVIAGEQLLSRNMYRWMHELLPNGIYVNEYGPTETTVGATTYWGLTPSKVAPDSPHAVPIGKPLDNTRLYILDAQQNVVPFGAIGELYIGGAGLSRGYINRPELNRDKFVHKTFADGLQEALYRTGDLVRYQESGNVEFIGRVDHQVKIRGLRIELGEIDYLLTQQESVRQAVVIAVDEVQNEQAQTQTQARKQTHLVAYIVPEHGNASKMLSDEALWSNWIDTTRQYLQSQLPPYMVPNFFIALKELPLNVNGKVDRHALPKPNFEAYWQQMETRFVAPVSEIESQLQGIWASVLKTSAGKLSVSANFFELGGDSILSIQVVSRAAKQGLYFTVKDLFKAQTIRQLAPVVRTEQAVNAPQDAVTGEQILLPVQKRFFQNEADLHHYNQAMLLNTPIDFDERSLLSLVRKLIDRHDALRLKFRRLDIDKGTRWQGHYAPMSSTMLENAIAISDWPIASFEGIEEKATQYQQALDPEQGKMLKVVYFRPEGQCSTTRGESRIKCMGRLLIVIHHLAVDGVSWRILLDDLDTLYQQWREGTQLTLSAKTSSYQQWGEWLQAYRNGEVIDKEQEYWAIEARKQVPQLSSLPCVSSCVHEPDSLELGEIEEAQTPVSVASFSLDAALTQELLSTSHQAYRTRVNELLLSGLLLGIQQWSGEQTIRIDLESHGREEINPALDVSQTVGWFTSVYPLVLQSLLSVDSGKQDRTARLENLICDVKEQYRAVPNQGIGFGVLKYLSSIDPFVELPESEILFNYLGQFDQVVSDTSEEQVKRAFTLAKESSGQAIGLGRLPHYPLVFNGMVVNEQLTFHLTYDNERFSASAMHNLLNCFEQALSELVAYCRTVQQGRYTPSDFPLAKISPSELNDWQVKYPQIEQLLPATGMQQGMLFQGLLHSGTYVTQTLLRAQGLQLDVLQYAWQWLAKRHALFRTAFVGLETGNAHQLVLPEVDLPWHVEDLSSLSDSEQQERIEAIRAADKAQGFNVEQAPLMRFSLLNLEQGKAQRQVFIWSHHHALLDGWSKPIVFGELTQIYGFLSQWQEDGKALNEATLADIEQVLKPHRPFSDYVDWLDKRSVKQGRAFWKDQLASVEAATPLPLVTESARNARVAGEYLKHSVLLSESETEQLQQLARKTHTTVNVIVQACWSLLLSAYSGQQQVVFGATTSGRPAELVGVEEMVGLFINTIPVVIDVDAQQTVGEWLQQIHALMTEREAHSDVPLVEILRQSPVKQGLFDSLLVFENYPIDEAIGQRVNEASIGIETVNSFEGTNYGISLLVNMAAQLAVNFEVQAGLLTQQSIEQIARHMKQLLLDMVNRAQEPVSKVVMLSSDDFRHLAAGIHSEPVQFDRDATIYQQFEAQAAKTPQAIALVYESQSLTYKELNARANQLAHYLIAQGVQADERVALFMERSLEMVIAMLAVVKAGGAYLPIDPDFPDARIAYMLEDSGARILLTQSHLQAKVAKIIDESIDSSKADIQMLALDEQSRIWSDLQTHNPQREGITSQNLAYVIYTSGSTGNPKGVMLSHQALVNRIDWMHREYGCSAQDIILQKTPYSFDVSVWEFFWPLIKGAKLVMAKPGGHKQPDYLAEIIKAHGVTKLHFVPSMLSSVLATNALAECSSIQQVFCSGEALLPSQVQGFYQMLPHAQLHNLYGPTEAAIDVSYFDCSALVQDATATVPIGKPIQNIQLYVFDAAMRLVPPGAVGELHIGGVGLARGYLNREQLTAEKFIQNPLVAMSELPERLYKTGDLVRQLEDGNLEYLGRMDDQVKIRGFRIELGEIEALLNDYVGLQQAVVIARESRIGSEQKQSNKYLVAYFVSAQPNVVEAELVAELKEWLSGRLPDYMIPTAFVRMDSIPLTSNGKVNRRSLPEPQFAVAESEYIAPRTSTEKAICAVWQQVLGVERVGVTDNFFQLGGDSLQMIVLKSSLKHAGFDLDLAEFTKHPYIASVYASGESLPREENQERDDLSLTVSKPEINPGSGRRYLFLPPNQRRSFATKDDNRNQFTASIMDRIYLEYPEETIEKAVRKIGQIHDALRVRSECVDGVWAQYIEDEFRYGLHIHDLSELDEQSQIDFIVKTCKASNEGMDILSGLLFHLALFKKDDSNWYTGFFVLHHTMADGVCFNIIMEDLKRAIVDESYGVDAESKDSSASLADARAKYSDYCEMWREFSSSEQFLQNIDAFAQDPEKTASTDFYIDNRVDFIGADQQEQKFKVDVGEEILRLHTRDVHAIALAAVSKAVAAGTDVQHVSYRVLNHGRDYSFFSDLDFSETVGWFATELPLWVAIKDIYDKDAIKTIIHDIDNVKESGLAYTMGIFHDDPVVQAKARQVPIPQIIFNYINIESQEDHMTQDEDFPERKAVHKALTYASNDSVKDFRFFIEVNYDKKYRRLYIKWQYSKAQYHSETIKRFQRLFEKTLMEAANAQG
ncbi:amino acid adenylation domain-containing protein [Paraneptunicella aestuarii]|uniref:non-ribosomal peptide synthetase n=1 Tax=Paraneptunicella aestuarii TaxID=2831148 RepID=UPI001E446032|nr:non-ribosomal peptide synthetase [Paraneptunicella aestuarii]UAA39976.1 amino acid adenylation domain-containing protein [Paraneptunicella aestuarii]